jgi:hypothetical protein
MVLFFGGIFVMLAGILRCVLILENTVTGARDGSAWAVREAFVAVVTSNFPVVFSLFRTWLGPWVGSLSRRKGSGSNRTGGVPHGSIPLPDRSWAGQDKEFDSKGTVSVFALSQERIIDLPTAGIKVERDAKISSAAKPYSRRSENDSDF